MLETESFERALYRQDQVIGLEGLFDEIVSAFFDRRHGGLDVAVFR